MEKNFGLLLALEGKVIGGYRIHVDVRKSSYAERCYFRIYLKKNDEISNPVFEGIYSKGLEYANVRGWIDGNYIEDARFPKEGVLNLSESGLAVELFKILGGFIPPGGSFMVSYRMFSGEGKVHRETEWCLEHNVPAIATPIGWLLFLAGCGFGMKNWYIPEGGSEGPPKIQGFKAIDDEYKTKKSAEIIEELNNFISKKPDGINELEQEARGRAEKILRLIKTGNYNLC